MNSTFDENSTSLYAPNNSSQYDAYNSSLYDANKLKISAFKNASIHWLHHLLNNFTCQNTNGASLAQVS